MLNRLLLFFCVFFCFNSYSQELLITNAHIIIGNDSVIENGSINIINGRIEAVTEGEFIVSHTNVINANGMTAMPAFIDGTSAYNLQR